MRRWRDERGAAAVEFALISTILFVVLFAIIEFGIALNQYQIFVQAAREGARQAAVGADNASVLAAIDNAAGDGYDEQITEDATIQTCTPSGAPSQTCVSGGDQACTPDNAGAADALVFWNQNLSIVIPFIPDLSRFVTVRAEFRCE
jgi:Flp pilus assembly protein TadG